MILGLSTGCFYKFNINIYQKIENILNSRSNAIEISFPFKDDFLKFKPFKIENMNWISIHLPWKNIIYSKNKETQHILNKIKEIEKIIEVKYFIIHPNVVKNFNVLENFNLLVENLGSIEKFGSKLKDLKKIKREFNPNFLLDLAHIYKIDNHMKQLNDTIKLFNRNLKMIHVSGFKNNNEHSMLYNADNIRGSNTIF